VFWARRYARRHAAGVSRAATAPEVAVRRTAIHATHARIGWQDSGGRCGSHGVVEGQEMLRLRSNRAPPAASCRARAR